MVGKNLGRFLGLAVAARVVLVGAGTASATDVFNMPLGQTSLVMVPVGNPGNANDPATGFGQVGYAYNMGKYDVTAGQYTAFLNAVASTSDTYGLYNPYMVPHNSPFTGCGIVQTSVAGGYRYTVDAQHQNYPVNYVTFWDACRFTNWLQNNQPTGAEGVGTTETGAYDLTNPMAIANNTVTRSTGATWAVASENEWYKAAYYDPTLNNGAGGYWLYPTRSNRVPDNSLSNAATDPNDANSCNGDYTDPTNYLTPVGTFAASPSAYGTYDQGGDVLQWNDTAIYMAFDGSLLRGLRGGSYYYYGGYLWSGYRDYGNPTHENFNIGFRVSQVPEPASLGVLGMGVMGMLMRRRGFAK